MAVAVPIIMAAAGAGTVATIGTSLVLAAAGINSRIDKAASKVFGEDVVKWGNVAGVIALGAGAFDAGGVFGSAAAGGDAAASAGGYVNAMDAASDVASAASAGAPTAALDPIASMSGLAGTAPAGALAAPAGAATAAAKAPVPATTPAAPGMVDKAVAAFKAMDPRVQAALVQIGGGALAGYGQSKEARAAEDRGREYDSRYRSGSGLQYWAKQPAYTGAGG